MKSAFQASISLSLAGGLTPTRLFPTPHRFDIIIKNGLVLDGISDSAFKTDLGIIGEHVEVMGKLDSNSAKDVIDATDKIVAPGFIDIHSHAALRSSGRSHPHRQNCRTSTPDISPQGCRAKQLL